MNAPSSYRPQGPAWPFLAQLGRLFNSLRARLTLLLALGIALASLLSLFVAEMGRHHYYAMMRLDHIADGTADLSQRYARDPLGTEALLHDHEMYGVRAAPADWQVTSSDPDLHERLIARLGPQSQAAAMQLPREGCIPGRFTRVRVAGMEDPAIPDCWLVRFIDTRGQLRKIVIYQPKLGPMHYRTPVDPLYILLILLASGVLSTVVSRLAMRPLQRLAEAARAFSLSVDPEPIRETGPQEVRAALATFNLMQTRIRAGFAERTHMLASIAHDLQTPLTRLRLRLEDVEDDTLRARLIADLAATQQMVRAGLDLARSSEMREPWSMVDIDSIIASIAEDAAEFGADVRFAQGCGLQVRAKPNALIRCLTNLVENAIKYGGGAVLTCQRAQGELVITVRDHGPGIAEAHLVDVFEPFRRYPVEGAAAPGGTGLGLAIAQGLARSFGGRVELANHPDGGLVARITLEIA